MPPRSRSDRTAGRRSREESERTRTRLLDEAERLFAHKGYRGVSLRELARAAGVRPFTIQHHFGSKLALYERVLNRWDDAIQAQIEDALAGAKDLEEATRRVTDCLFDFMLEKREWMALNARAALGEGLPTGVTLREQSWVRFTKRLRRARKGTLDGLDPRLLLITVEGILSNHVLARAHYEELFGRDVSDPRLKARTRRHLQQVILLLARASTLPTSTRS